MTRATPECQGEEAIPDVAAPGRLEILTSDACCLGGDKLAAFAGV